MKKEIREEMQKRMKKMEEERDTPRRQKKKFREEREEDITDRIRLLQQEKKDRG